MSIAQSNLTPMLFAQRFSMLLATLQGLLLLALYRAHLGDVWPVTDMMWAVPAWTLALIFPVVLLFATSGENLPRALGYAGLLSLVLTLCGLYIGFQLALENHHAEGSVLTAFVFCMVIAVFKGLMYVQQRTSAEPLSYPLLFSLSWRNFLVMSLALLFVGIVALLLLLWSSLFKAIGVDFFEYLFGRDWFLFPLLGFAFGVGIAVFRELSRVLDSITGLLQGMIRFLLPLLLVMTVVFLVTLAVVGLDGLWSTGFGSGLVLWLTAVLLFFVNAVYQDGRGDLAYSIGIHRLIYAGLLTLPILSVISGYGLWLRIDQYGISVERVFAGAVWIILALFALGYSISIVLLRDGWTHGLASVNTKMGLVVLALIIGLNSPLLDPRVMTVNSQLERLSSGIIRIDEVDLVYFRQELARVGVDAVAELRLQYETAHPELAWDGYQYPAARLSSQERSARFWRQVSRQPQDLEIPDSLKQALDKANVWYDMTGMVMTRFDLSGDGIDEYLLFNITVGQSLSGWYFIETTRGWEYGSLSPPNYQQVNATFVKALRAGEYSVEPRALSDIRIGDMVLRPQMSAQGLYLHNQAFGIHPEALDPAGRPVGYQNAVPVQPMPD